MQRSFALALFLLCSLACVSTHVGRTTASYSTPLVISCAPTSDLMAEQFKALSCTLENPSEHWLDVKVTSVQLLPHSGDLHISTPREINDFLSAYAHQAEQDAENTRILLASLVALGTGAALSTDDDDVALVGSVAMAAGSATAAAHSPGVRFSADHLLGNGIRVPPRLYTRKFVLVETAPGAKPPHEMRLCFELPTAECLDVALTTMTGYGQRGWQL